MFRHLIWPTSTKWFNCNNYIGVSWPKNRKKKWIRKITEIHAWWIGAIRAISRCVIQTRLCAVCLILFDSFIPTDTYRHRHTRVCIRLIGYTRRQSPPQGRHDSSLRLTPERIKISTKQTTAHCKINKNKIKLIRTTTFSNLLGRIHMHVARNFKLCLGWGWERPYKSSTPVRPSIWHTIDRVGNNLLPPVCVQVIIIISTFHFLVGYFFTSYIELSTLDGRLL
jgi:hypothetical protein